jgi:transaldolase
MPEHTIAAFEDHGKVARTLDERVDDAVEVFDRLRDLGVDMTDVARTLEEQGLAAFSESHNWLLARLAAKAAGLVGG